MSRVAIVLGHPDQAAEHYCHALADAYAEGAKRGNHDVRRIDIAALEFPLLQSQEEYDSGPTPDCLRQAQSDLLWADHYVIIYPLWMGTMPAKLKGFLEQVFRPDVVYEASDSKDAWKKLLRGKSARIVVTMGMPAPIYRWYFGAHGLRNLERNILGFVGVRPIRTTLIGMVEDISDEKRKAWIRKLQDLGVKGG